MTPSIIHCRSRVWRIDGLKAVVGKIRREDGRLWWSVVVSHRRRSQFGGGDTLSDARSAAHAMARDLRRKSPVA